MKFKVLSLLVVVFLVSVLFSLWWFTRTPEVRESPVSEAPRAEGDEADEAAPVTGRGTFAELQALGRSLECTIIERGAENEALEGTAFFNNGRLRGDFVIPAQGSSSVTSMVVADGRLYVWSEIEGERYGVQVSVASLEQAADTRLDAREPVSLDEEVNYNCVPWPTVDNSIFVPPGDVLFRDLDDLAEQGMEYGTVFPE